MTKAERQEKVTNSKKPFLLNEHNFHDYVITADTHELILDRSWFLNFYAPWCDHCQIFEPTWDDFHAKNKE